MVGKEIWLSLPVKDISNSKKFFEALGFSFKPGPGNTPHSAPLVIANLIIMLFEEPIFKGFVNKAVPDTAKYSEVLLSMDASSIEEIDQFALKVIAAGGKTAHKPAQVQKGMYGFVFSDLDDHQWNVLYMD